MSGEKPWNRQLPWQFLVRQQDSKNDLQQYVKIKASSLATCDFIITYTIFEAYRLIATTNKSS